MIGSLGWVILGAYQLDEYSKHGSLSEFYKHMIMEMTFHHALMFLMVPVMMYFGYIFDRKLRLEEGLQEYTGQLEQTAWTTSTELIASEKKYRALIESSIDGIAIRQEGKLLYVNAIGWKMLGYGSDEEVVGKPVLDFVHPDYHDVVKERVKTILETGESVPPYDEKFLRKDGSALDVEIFSVPITYKGKPAIQVVFRDITERKEAEDEIRRKSAVLKAVNKIFEEALTCETEEELGKICLSVAEELTGSKFGFFGEINEKGLFDTIAISNPGWSVCDMAVQDAKKHTVSMPIRGVDRGAMKDEKSRILNGEEAIANHPDHVETPKGHPPITAFLGVPLKYQWKTIGMIGLGNKEGGYDTNDQKNIEALSVAMVEAFKRKRADEEIERNWQIQGAINSVLQISMEPISLEEQLERSLDVILSVPWIVFKKKGAIFLVEDAPEVLVMKAQRGLHEALMTTCEKVPFGRCICGRAAASKDTYFVDRVDERHDNTYEGIVPHGHYCVPILSGGRVLGVLNLYVKEGHKRNEREEAFLRSVANTLAGIVERRQAQEALENAYEELKSVDRVKDDIISNVSHELRTPITVVKGALEIALSEEDAQARNKLLEMAKRALVKQNRIVGNLIEVAQVQKKKLELSIEEIDLDYVVSLAVGGIKHDAEGKEIKIEQEVPDITVMADFERIKNVLLNLLDNAVKFSNRGERIKVSAGMKDNMAEVCVEDTGTGIPEEFHEKIFDRLFQADATTTRRFAGTGMGLAVAREIVEAHGGKIWVESKKKGCTLCFTLPISKKG